MVESEIFVEDIVEVESDSVPESKGAGFTFFPAESDAWPSAKEIGGHVLSRA